VSSTGGYHKWPTAIKIPVGYSQDRGVHHRSLPGPWPDIQREEKGKFQKMNREGGAMIRRAGGDTRDALSARN